MTSVKPGQKNVSMPKMIAQISTQKNEPPVLRQAIQHRTHQNGAGRIGLSWHADLLWLPGFRRFYIPIQSQRGMTANAIRELNLCF